MSLNRPFERVCPPTWLPIQIILLCRKIKCHKISSLNVFPFKFRVYDNFYALCQFLASARFQLNV